MDIDIVSVLGEPESYYISDSGYVSIDYDLDDCIIDLTVYKDGGLSSVGVRYYNWNE